MVLTQEIESVLYPRNPRVLWGESQTPFFEKLFYRRFDCPFEKFFRFPGDDKVVGVADDVYLGAVGGNGLDRRFQPVQSHIGQERGDDAPLRGSRLGRIECPLFKVSCAQPMTEHEAIHQDVLHEPVVADFVETGFYVPFKYPLRRVPLCQSDVALVDGIGATSMQTKSV